MNLDTYVGLREDIFVEIQNNCFVLNKKTENSKDTLLYLTKINAIILATFDGVTTLQEISSILSEIVEINESESVKLLEKAVNLYTCYMII